MEEHLEIELKAKIKETGEVKNKTFTFPLSWEDVKFSQLVDIENIKNDKLNSLSKIKLRTLVILCEDEEFESYFMHIKREEMEEIFEMFEWINESPDITNIKESKYIEIEGERFTMKSDYDSLTANEVIMIEELSNSGMDILPIEAAFGVLFRKIGEDGQQKELTLDGVKEVLTKFKSKVYLKDVYANLNFFLSGGQKHSQNGHSSLKMKRVKRKENTEKSIQKSGKEKTK